jgi:hypothetical protein
MEIDTELYQEAEILIFVYNKVHPRFSTVKL